MVCAFPMSKGRDSEMHEGKRIVDRGETLLARKKAFLAGIVPDRGVSWR